MSKYNRNWEGLVSKAGLQIARVTEILYGFPQLPARNYPLQKMPEQNIKRGGANSAASYFLSVLQFTVTLRSIFLRYDTTVAHNCVNKTVIVIKINAASFFHEQLIFNKTKK